MTRAPSLSPLLAKEFRALLPLWTGTLLGLVAAFAWRGRLMSDIGIFAYVAGAISLGAHSFGHEYGHRTLPMLLAQPVPRWRLFAAKFLVVGVMLAALAAAAAAVFAADGFRGNDAWRVVVMPLMAGVFITPLFTMMCRSTLAGAVLGASSPMTLWVFTLLVGWWAFGVDGDTITARLFDRWALLAVVACPILAALTWRAFTRLETVEGMPATLTLPRWLSARAGVRRTAPWRALVAKELHLQQLTIAITLFYGVIWVIGVGIRDTIPAGVTLPLEAVLLLYCMGLTIVIGALASAEERQQGTLEVQLLQPIGARQQWLVKCAVTLGLAIVLGVLLPALLIAGFSESPQLELSPNLVLLVIMLTSSSLYISSLAGSGVKAMAWSVPAGIGAAIFIQTMQTAIVLASRRLGAPLAVDQIEVSIVASQLLTILIVPMLLWFGFVNHTSAEHPLRRTLAQIGGIAMLIASGLAAAGALI